MQIKVLDKASLGEDTPFDTLGALGVLSIFDSTSDEQMQQRLLDADVIIINKIKINEGVLAMAPRLKLICVFATGYDNVDLDAARAYGIGVCNVPAYSTDSVALLTVATTLALVCHLKEYSGFVSDGSYERSGVPNRLTPVFHEIRSMTWGIVGYGNIGKAVANVARAMGARVIANKRTPISEVECVDIDTLCAESDIITLHCPLNDSTRGIIDAKRLSLMKPNVVLVNEARGAVVDEQAVTDALLNGKIGAFGCDVYSTEPIPPSHPYEKIKSLNNVILTPHAAWGAYEARVRCVNTIAENIHSFIQGEKLNRVDII